MGTRLLRVDRGSKEKSKEVSEDKDEILTWDHTYCMDPPGPDHTYCMEGATTTPKDVTKVEEERRQAQCRKMDECKKDDQGSRPEAVTSSATVGLEGATTETDKIMLEVAGISKTCSPPSSGDSSLNGCCRCLGCRS